MKSLISIVLLLLPLVLTDVASGDSMKCGTRLVSRGDGKAKVLLRCGEPFFREIIGEKTYRRRFFRFFSRSSTYIVERWTYDLGSNRFLRILTFEGDRLVKIELGDKP